MTHLLTKALFAEEHSLEMLAFVLFFVANKKKIKIHLQESTVVSLPHRIKLLCCCFKIIVFLLELSYIASEGVIRYGVDMCEREKMRDKKVFMVIWQP